MSAPEPQEPPPIPPPSGNGVFLTDAELAELTLPRPAPFGWRVLAYLLDWSIAMVAVLLILKWLIPLEHAEGWAELKRWSAEISNDYMASLRNPAASLAQQMELNRRILEKASAVPESVTALITFVALVQTFFFWGFFTITEYFTKGQSLGKKICNLRVASLDIYSPPRFFDSLVRSGWKSVFYCSSSLLLLLFGAIDAHVPLFNKRRRSWHDMLSRTEVIDANTDPWIPPLSED